jgi:serine/threonine-protein kinase PpkA
MAQKYDKWIVKRSLSEGGQAHTFIVVEEGAEDKGEFVLKRFRHPERLQRCRNEVNACLRLSHPNVIKVEASNFDKEPYFIVTEYCQGGPLSKADLSRYSTVERFELFAAVSSGVAHAHSQGVTHRDLKPENIFFKDEFTPVVGDFGICYLTEEDRATELHEWVGPRNLIPPELEGGRLEHVEPSADVYMLGKLLYWLMAGRYVPRERYREATFDLTKDQKNPEIFFVYELLDRMIVENPSDRFSNATAVVEAVEITIRRILMHAHPIDVAVPQHCMYCGIGTYKIALDSSRMQGEEVRSKLLKLGFNTTALQLWLILVCDYCGNMQSFRPDRSNDKTIWWRKR